jgi:hypothetical protein
LFFHKLVYLVHLFTGDKFRFGNVLRVGRVQLDNARGIKMQNTVSGAIKAQDVLARIGQLALQAILLV